MITTMTTVGYGEISQVNVYERVLGIVILLFGSVCFAFCAGAIASLITNFDNMQEGLKSKLEVLAMIKEKYQLEYEFAEELETTLKFEYTKIVDGLPEFMH